MPEDAFHRYINFQIDHKDAAKGQFRGFYILSPNFKPGKNVTFLLTDGQMELVSTRTDINFFEEILGSTSYVLIGVRGHSPTFLPEVYKNGKVDMQAAFDLYGSDQQVEDIEQVRLEMQKNGQLGDDGKINVFGASGAGVLAQQYLSKYGKNVGRVILESTGAPDISEQHGIKYSPDFKDYNPEADVVFAEILKRSPSDRAAISNILYQQGRTQTQPRETQKQTLNDLSNGGFLLKYRFSPINNLWLLNYIIKAPRSISARVRWFELVGDDLLRYSDLSDVNLLYDISKETMSDIVEYHKTNNLSAKVFDIKRDFAGEVLILKGTEDVVFGDEINRALQQAYPNARLMFFDDGHRLQKDKDLYKKIRTSFFEKGFESDIIKAGKAVL